MARKPQTSLCQAVWPVGCERTSLLDGYNNTCKALKISDIIRGIRGKRDSNNEGTGCPESSTGSTPASGWFDSCHCWSKTLHYGPIVYAG